MQLEPRPPPGDPTPKANVAGQPHKGARAPVQGTDTRVRPNANTTNDDTNALDDVCAQAAQTALFWLRCQAGETAPFWLPRHTTLGQRTMC